MIDKIKSIAIPLTILIISFILILILIPDYHPFGDLKISKDPDSILLRAETYLDSIGINFNENKINIKIEENKPFSRWIKSENRLDSANKILREAGFAYFWTLSQDLENDHVIIGSSNSENAIRKSSFRIQMLDDEKIIEFNQELVDSSIKISLSQEDAKKLAQNFVHLFRPEINFIDDTVQTNNEPDANTYLFKENEKIDKPNRVDYNFIWQTKTADKLNYSIEVKIIGNQLANFTNTVIVPTEYEKAGTDIFEVSTTVLLILLITISVIIVGFKRFRAFEVGFKLAIVFGIIIVISFLLKEFLEEINNFEISTIIGLSLGGFFVAGIAIILWAVSETIFREIWNNKFLSLDLIYHRKINHSVVGKSVINGISFGLGLTALFFLLLFIISNYLNFAFTGNNFTSQTHLTATLPLLNAFFGVFNAYGILAVGFLMFLTAAIKRYINNDTVFIFVCGLAWALLVPSNISSVPAGIPINFLIGIFLFTILIKYDLLSALLSYILFEFFIKVTEFEFFSDATLVYQWYYLIAICLVLVIAGVILILRKDTFTDYDSITPKFVENITERQRLKQELDVARHVQMSFLPKENPVLNGIDIASTCIPAMEVGGDYYDFIHLGKDKLGIIIGDVSGKGTQAAFYMTLTKGFLKALAKQTESPSEVLTKMNELFYENVERGRFISMIYAIVDLKEMKIKIARAGHNPIIFHDDEGNINLINPDGMALGLEKGPLFSKVITEHEENLKPGKTFIFYTDGFSEAVNKKGQEYGLERMFDIAKNYNHNSASQLQDKMIEDINKFIGKAKQHDDMTMVILKVS